jgi:UDP-N-acetylmuramoyl-tripeptide--D-alanyl-D-alanine ligase
MNITVSDLLSIDHMNAYNIDALIGKTISGVSTDSRTVKPGQVFFAIKGETYDGNEFIGQAFKNGAVSAVIHEKANIKPFHETPFCVVNDTTKALGKLANIYRHKFAIPFIAVAGSNGKTTTKEMMAAVLGTEYSVLSTEGNLNNQIGVPQTLFRLNDGHEVAVVEIGTSHFGELSYLCDILEPTHGLITNIGHEHLEFFKNLSGVAKAESELFQALGKNGLGFVNADDKHIILKAKKLKRKTTYGFSLRNINVRGKYLGLNAQGRTQLAIMPKGGKSFTVKLSSPGHHAMHNALAAATVGISFGISSRNIQRALKTFKPVSKRMEMLTIGGVTILNDTYNANPDSVLMALETLRSLKCRGKKFIILADMLELGERSEIEHKRIGTALNRMGFDYVLTFGQTAEVIYKHSRAKIKAHFEQKDKLSEFAAQLVSRGDIVLVKGSRGMKMEEVVLFIQNHLEKIS